MHPVLLQMPRRPKTDKEAYIIITGAVTRLSERITAYCVDGLLDAVGSAHEHCLRNLNVKIAPSHCE